MTSKRVIQRGFTLIELLVVVTVLGLLAIAVMPAFTAGGDRRLLLGTAERLDTHLKHAAARATGKPRGAGVLLQADVGGVAALDIEFVRVSSGRVNDVGRIYEKPPLHADGSQVFTPPLSPLLASERYIAVDSDAEGADGTNNRGFTIDDDGAIVQFGTSLEVYEIDSIVFPLSHPDWSIAKIKLPGGQTPYNSIFPAADEVNLIVFAPPKRPELTKRPTVFPNQACVDLSASTIGVYGYGDALSGGFAPITLNSYDKFVICFDVYGKAKEAWGWSGASVTRIPLTPGKPIALLCTLAFQAGKPFVSDYSTVTDLTPGAGYQNPDAFWVVIDPKTGRSFIVENSFEPSGLAEAQTFVKDDLMGN
jgi:prepilin-type N-terminal cleavage/methylation domain-containing protein